MRHRRRFLPFVVCLMVVSAGGVSATVTTFFRAHLPLLDPQAGVTVTEVLFRSGYAQPESRIGAAAWPYRVNAGPGESGGENLNLADLLGVTVSICPAEPGKNPPWHVVLDLSDLKKMPEPVREQWPKLSRQDVVKALVVATTRNLKLAGIARCPLAVRGADKHEDLADMRFPSVLNVPPPPKPEEKQSK